jgi:hypothetical protein
MGLARSATAGLGSASSEAAPTPRLGRQLDLLHTGASLGRLDEKPVDVGVPAATISASSSRICTVGRS